MVNGTQHTKIAILSSTRIYIPVQNPIKPSKEKNPLNEGNSHVSHTTKYIDGVVFMHLTSM